MLNTSSGRCLSEEGRDLRFDPIFPASHGIEKDGLFGIEVSCFLAISALLPDYY